MWEMAPNEQNWEGDSICHSRTDSVCIGSCWMQPARLRPVEQECCTRRGVGTAWLSTPQLQGGRQRLTPRQQDPAGIPSWHLLHAGADCGESDFDPSCSELHTFLPFLPFSSPYLTYPWSPISLLFTVVLSWSSPASPRAAQAGESLGQQHLIICTYNTDLCSSKHSLG